MRNSDEAEELLTAVHTPGNAKFHQFLTPAQFEQRFGPNAADVAKVIAHFNKLGLSAQRSTATTLTVTGSSDAMERAFSVSSTLSKFPPTAKTLATPITRR